MSASVSDQENATGQEHKSISKENLLSQGLLLAAKGWRWVGISCRDDYSHRK